MKIVVKEPGREPEARDIEHSLDVLQGLVTFGNYRMLELIADHPPGLDLFANEEGKYASRLVPMTDEDVTVIEYPLPNLSLWDGRDYVLGTVFVSAADDEGEARTLTQAEVDLAIAWLKEHAVDAAGSARAVLMADRFR